MLQDNYLFSMSIYDNLKVGCPNITKEEVIAICKKINLHDFIMSFDCGYDTVLLSGGTNLSQGQKQLLCYARVIITNPKIIILDEATSKIDTFTEKYLNDSLKEVFDNRTIIMIAHRLSTITDCDKIMVVKDSGIIETGSHQELMKKKGEYYKLYTSQI